MSFFIGSYTPEDFEVEFGKPAGEAFLEINSSKGEIPYGLWVSTCEYGQVAMLKVLAKIKEGKVTFCVIIEFLDKEKLGCCFSAPKNIFDKKIQTFLKKIRIAVNKTYKVSLNPWVDATKQWLMCAQKRREKI